MLIPTGTHLAVADGARLLLLRNAGDTRKLDLEVIHADAQESRPDRELSADRPGRSFQSFSTRRSAYEETDFKQLAEDRFAAEAATLLNSMALAGDIERLIVIAAPRTLGEMRQHWHKVLAERIVAEIPKTLTGRSVAELERILAEA